MSPVANVVPDLLRQRATESADTVALVVDRGPSLSYGEWEKRSNALARGLVDHGVRVGDRIALLFDNARWTDYAVAYVATHKAGAIAVPLGPRFRPAELATVLGHTGAVGVVHTAGLVPADAPGWVAEPATLEHGQATDAFQVPLAPGDVAEILYTSGTTGTPKGVACTHENVLFHDPPPEPQPELGPEPGGSGARASLVHSFPVGTNAGQEVLRVPLRRGDRTVVVLPVFEAERFCALVAEHGVRRLQLVPAMAQVILRSGAVGRHDLSSVERVVLSSAPTPPSLLRELAAALPHATIWNTYALTEGGTARTLMVYDERRPTSVGKGVGPTEVRVVDDDGHDPPTGEPGEVWLRRTGYPRRFYWNDPEATASGFAGDWLRTGDVGRLDDEGFLHLVDRKKDLVISGGLNVSSIEVEGVLEEHPAVAEAAVFGVAHEVLGQDVGAAVVTREPVTGEQVQPFVRQLQSFVRERLAEHKTPHHVFLVEALPRNPSGKVLKRELRERFGAGAAATAASVTAAPTATATGGPGDGPRTDAERVVVAIFEEVLQRSGVGVHDDFFALGGHSLAATQVIARVNDALGADVSPVAVFDAPTAAELAALAAGSRQAAAG